MDMCPVPPGELIGTWDIVAETTASLEGAVIRYLGDKLPRYNVAGIIREYAAEIQRMLPPGFSLHQVRYAWYAPYGYMGDDWDVIGARTLAQLRAALRAVNSTGLPVIVADNAKYPSRPVPATGAPDIGAHGRLDPVRPCRFDYGCKRGAGHAGPCATTPLPPDIPGWAPGTTDIRDSDHD